VLRFLPAKIIIYFKKYYLTDTKLARTGTELRIYLVFWGKDDFGFTNDF